MNGKENNYSIEDLYKTLDRVTLWTENCDTKASIILGAFGIFLSIIFSNGIITSCKTIYFYMTNNANFLSLGYLALVSISIVSMLLGCYFLISVLVPRTKSKKYKAKGVLQQSLLFFNSIANYNLLDDFKENIKGKKVYNLEDDLISQIYICSIICKKKFSSYKKGIILTLLGFGVFLFLYCIGNLIV